MLEQEILDEMTNVGKSASRLSRYLPVGVSRSDLLGEGAIALIEAARRFDRTRGVPFGCFARPRYDGRMLDFLRRERNRPGYARSEPPRDIYPGTEELASDIEISHKERPWNEESRIGNAIELVRARSRLTAREEHVIVLLFYCDWTSREVSKLLRIHESRVSQIKFMALEKMRKHFVHRRIRQR